jgi:hypothetical protein
MFVYNIFFSFIFVSIYIRRLTYLIIKTLQTMKNKLYSFFVIFLFLFVFQSVAQVGIGTTSPDAKSALEVKSTTAGLLIPRMNTTQRNAIVSPPDFLMINNSSTGCLEVCYSGTWRQVWCSGIPCTETPAAPTANAATSITGSSFVASWTAATGAISYYLDVASDAGFVNTLPGLHNCMVMGTNYTVEGLNCGKQYYYRVRAYNNCGTSGNSNVIMAATSFCLSDQNCFEIGGTGAELANGMIRTSDGGYALCGYTASWGAGNNDMLVIKLDASGTITWTKTIGGSGQDYGYDIVQSSDGGLVILGSTYTYGAGNSDFFVVKLDAGGNYLWSKAIGGTSADFPSAIAATSDGGYIAVGYTLSFGVTTQSTYVVKLDASGGVTWSKTYYVASGNTDMGFDIIPTADGGYAVAGSTYNGSGTELQDGMVLKLTSTGVVSWCKTYGFTGSDALSTIIQTTDGGYFLGGFEPGSANNAQIVKLSSAGALSWNRSIGGASALEEASEVIATSDGGYMMVGNTVTYGAGNRDVYFTKWTNTGTLSWTRAVGGSAIDASTQVVQLPDNGYFALATTTSFGAGSNDFYLIKIEQTGAACCSSGSGGNVTSPSMTVTTPSPSTGTQTSSVASPSPTVSSQTPTVTSNCSL